MNFNMNIISWILHYDEKLFLMINIGLKNSFFDWLMPIVTNVKYWYIPIGLSWLLLMIFGGKKGRELGILCVITLIIADVIASKFLKVSFHRIRPCFSLGFVNLPDGPPGGALSFPSSHAVNVFAVSSIIFSYYRRTGLAFFAWSCVVGFSRIYVGVHFPLDVIVGIIVGIYIAVAVWTSAKLVKQFTLRKLAKISPI